VRIDELIAEEWALLLVAIARYSAHVTQECNDCAPDVLPARRADLERLDRLFARIQRSAPRSVSGQAPSDLAAPARLEDSMRKKDIDHLAAAIRSQVEKFSNRRLNDGDDVWRERELEMRCTVAKTADAIRTSLGLDAASFAAACGLHVSDGRDTHSDCHPGELTWEKPWAS